MLTGHEVALIPTVATVVAIVGGYVGVRSANRNALKVAREERRSKRQDDQLALKRVAYVRCLATLAELQRWSLQTDPSLNPGSNDLQRKIDLVLKANECVVEVDLLAPAAISSLARDTAELARNVRMGSANAEFTASVSTLQDAMREDVHDDQALKTAGKG